MFAFPLHSTPLFVPHVVCPGGIFSQKCRDAAVCVGCGVERGGGVNTTINSDFGVIAGSGCEDFGGLFRETFRFL